MAQGTARKRKRTRDPIILSLFVKRELLQWKVRVFVKLKRFLNALLDPVRRDHLIGSIQDFRVYFVKSRERLLKE